MTERAIENALDGMRGTRAPATDADWMEYQKLSLAVEIAAADFGSVDYDDPTRPQLMAILSAARSAQDAHVARMSGRTPEGR